MNEAELARNSQLTEFAVRDLNVEAVLPFEDNSFDVITNAGAIRLLPAVAPAAQCSAVRCWKCSPGSGSPKLKLLQTAVENENALRWPCRWLASCAICGGTDCPAASPGVDHGRLQ